MNHINVLIVEDDQAVSRALSKFFKEWGWVVYTAETVEHAIKYLDANFDLVTIDMMLPDGSGVEVMKEMRNRNIDTAICVTTGRDASEIQEIMQYNPTLVLKKPFIFEALQDLAAGIKEKKFNT